MKSTILKSLVITLLSFSFGLSGTSLNKIEIKKSEKNLIDRYRLEASNTWGIGFVWYFQNAEDKKYSEMILHLHHIAGNAQHILKMHNNGGYNIKHRMAIVYSDEANDFYEKNYVTGNSAEVFKEILKVLKSYKKASDKKQVRQSIVDLKNKTNIYHKDRYLAYRFDYPHHENNDYDISYGD